MTDPMKPETMGDMAEVLRAWKESGITKDSMKYVTEQVWWED